MYQSVDSEKVKSPALGSESKQKEGRLEGEWPNQLGEGALESKVGRPLPERVPDNKDGGSALKDEESCGGGRNQMRIPQKEIRRVP